MLLKGFVPGPDLGPLEAGGIAGKCTPALRVIRKALINSEEHREREVYHAQPRLCLQRIPRIDHGKPRAAVFRLAGFCVRLEPSRRWGNDSSSELALPAVRR